MFSQGIDTRRSRLKCLRGFEPNGSAIFGDLEDVKSLSHNNWDRGRIFITMSELCLFRIEHRGRNRKGRLSGLPLID